MVWLTAVPGHTHRGLIYLLDSAAFFLLLERVIKHSFFSPRDGGRMPFLPPTCCDPVISSRQDECQLFTASHFPCPNSIRKIIKSVIIKV